MEPSIIDYMDRAIELQGLSSDRDLARKMKKNQATISGWRSLKWLPTEEQMMALARLAGANEEQSLVLLNIWRAKDDPARDTYRRLLHRLTRGTGTALAAALALGVSEPAKAESPRIGHEERSVNKLTVEFPALYIMRFLRRVARRLGPRFRKALEIPGGFSWGVA
jgi:hypothetical protein